MGPRISDTARRRPRDRDVERDRARNPGPSGRPPCPYRNANHSKGRYQNVYENMVLSPDSRDLCALLETIERLGSRVVKHCLLNVRTTVIWRRECTCQNA